MAIAQLNLTDWPACRVELSENDRRAVPAASRRPAGTQIAASPNLDGRRLGIEVGLQHRLVTITLARPIPDPLID